MGRKQTVYLSNDVAKRLARFRGAINISAVCSAAIERELDGLEAAIAGTGNIDTMSADQLRELVKALLARQRRTE